MLSQYREQKKRYVIDKQKNYIHPVYITLITVYKNKKLYRQTKSIVLVLTIQKTRSDDVLFLERSIYATNNSIIHEQYRIPHKLLFCSQYNNRVSMKGVMLPVLTRIAI